MTRVSNLVQHQQLVAAMLQNQRDVALASLQVATGKRGDSYDDFGLDTVRQVKLSNVLVRENAYADNARRVADQLGAQDLQLGQIRDSALALRDAVLGALAAGEARGLDTAAEAAFGALRGALNADYAGSPLFGGGLAAGEAFVPADLSALVALADVEDAFANGGVTSKVTVGDSRSVRTGIGADVAGAPLASALRELGALLPLGGTLSAADVAALEALLPFIDAAVSDANILQAENGVLAAAADTALAAATERAGSFEALLAAIENVDPAEAITRLQAEQNALQASYQVFARLNELSLLDFI